MDSKSRINWLVLLTAGWIAAFECVPFAIRDSVSIAASVSSPAPNAQALTPEEQGKALYENGRFSEAVTVLQQAVQQARSRGDTLRQAIALSNLSLASQQLGLWTEANQAITESLKLLRSTHQQTSVLAQALDIQGRLQLATGQAESALGTWQQATALYSKTNDQAGIVRSHLNQAQALQALGFHRRALTVLENLRSTLQNQPASLVKVVGLRSFGDALLLVGETDAANAVLQQSLELAKQLQASEETAAALLSLGNVAQTKRDAQAALAFYQQAATRSASPLTKVQAQLNQLSLLTHPNQRDNIQPLVRQIQPQLATLPPSRTAIEMQITFAQLLLKLPSFDRTAIAQQLAKAVQQARALNDRRSQSFALGTLAHVYEQNRQWSLAQDLTQQALELAEAMRASDIAYRWEWQLGRLLKAQGNSTGAIAAYTGAVNTLKSLRKDLVAVNPEIQFSFRESVEPIYRQLVDLLLQKTAVPSQVKLTQARDVIESLQVAELENFFRAACLDTVVQVDQVIDQADASAAVVYPIILSDRLEVILKLPRQELRHYTVLVPQVQVEQTLEQLQQKLTKPYTLQEVQTLSQQVYNWLIRPAEATFAETKPKTLVFVLDGALRNIPMSVLHDGQQYLIQKYGIALTPGLQLLNPRSLKQIQLRTLTAGLTESRHGFAPLSFVKNEVEEIQSEVPSKVLLNQTFTEKQLQEQINATPFSVVHLATHGQFSSDAEKTFILAWDQPIKVNEFNQLLRTKEQTGTGTIELLVLSACETAAGDNRAALGLAGVAIRAGARSTIASLWSLDDESTALFMGEFYRNLTQTTTTKSAALQDAQLKLLQNPQYQHPRYWAPYVLVGNWL
ncbi:CHAT domain-containing protein [Leptolyngbya sp. DQ-M1]|uniref:CHAT domain-containing protein n=1 Tax=Leptolyngbya sp. DQ-M1 TaxID=2933920 RepID=UPI0032968DA5